MTEEIIKNAFMSVFNEMVDNMDVIIAFVDTTIQALLKTDSLDKKIASTKRDSDKKLKVLQDYIQSGMRIAIKSEEHEHKVDELMAIYESVKAVQTQHEQTRASQIEQSRQCQAFIDRIKDRERLQEFDEALFGSIIKRIWVFCDKLVFELMDGGIREYML